MSQSLRRRSQSPSLRRTSAAAEPAGAARVPEPRRPSPRPRSPLRPPGPTPRSPSAYWNSWPQQTGYPTDLLDPDLDLEADLGIDTVKQAEVFAAIREAYGNRTRRRAQTARLPHTPQRRRVRARPHTPDHPSRHTRTPTHPHARGAGARGRQSPLRPPGPRPRSPSAYWNSWPQQTGYPTDLLDPDLDLEADLGIDTVKQAEVFAAIREAYAIERDDALKLRDYPTLRSVVGFVTRPHTPGHPSRHTRTPTHARARDAGARGAQSPLRPPGPTPRSPSAYWNSWPRRPAIRPTCSTPTSTSKPTSGSTPSNRPRCSPRSARPTQSNATTSLKLRDYPTLRSVVGFVHRPHTPGHPSRHTRTPTHPHSPRRRPTDEPATSRAGSLSPSCVRRFDCCVDTGVELAPGERVLADARSWRGRHRTRVQAGGPRPRGPDHRRAADDRRTRGATRSVDRGRTDRGRLLAAGARRRGGHR